MTEPSTSVGPRPNGGARCLQSQSADSGRRVVSSLAAFSASRGAAPLLGKRQAARVGRRPAVPKVVGAISRSDPAAGRTWQGHCPLLPAELCPADLTPLQYAFPSIRVTLNCQDTVVLLEKLKSGQIVLALTTELGCGKGGDTLRSERLVWAGAREGDAHTKDPLPVSLGADTCVFRPVAIAALKKGTPKLASHL